MSTNLFFNNFFASGEQSLVEDLVCESVKQFGIDVMYMPRTINNPDPIFNESTLQTFEKAIELEAYIRDVQGFTGDGKFLSKFGLEIRDEMTFSLTFRSFGTEVTSITGQLRPNEGDLIYFPLNGKCFSVKFVDQEAVFYQVGSLTFWDVVCEVFEYSNEKFATGVPYIDDKYNALTTVQETYELTDENGGGLTDEFRQPLISEASDSGIDPLDQSQTFPTAEQVIDWSELSPFGEQPQP